MAKIKHPGDFGIMTLLPMRFPMSLAPKVRAIQGVVDIQSDGKWEHDVVIDARYDVREVMLEIRALLP